MSGQATGWVLRHGPHPTQLDRHGTPYGARARGLRSVLVAVADAANRDGRHAHPGIENVADAALYGKRQTFNLLAELVAEGWLHVEHPGGGRGLATVYSLPRMDILNGATTASDDEETVQSVDGKGATGDHETLHSEAETLQSHVPDQHKRDANGLATVDSNGRQQPASPPTAATTGLVEAVFATWQTATNRPRSTLTPDRRRRIKAAVGIYGVDTCLDAVQGVTRSAFHAGQNDRGTRFDTIEAVFKNAGNVERFAELHNGAQERPIGAKAAQTRAVLNGFLADAAVIDTKEIGP